MQCDIPAVSALKVRGNLLSRGGNFYEAVQEYTKAVRIDPRDPVLYSNRSHAYLKLKQHFYALQDAKTAITLSPEWQKGYYRKGQVELDAEEYAMAIATLKQGILINPCDEGLRRALKNAENEAIKNKNMKARRACRFALTFGLMSVMAFSIDGYMNLNYMPTSSSWLVIFISTIVGYLSAYIFQRKENKLFPPIEALRQMTEDMKNLKTMRGFESDSTEHSYMSKFE